MAKYRVETDQGAFVVETDESEDDPKEYSASGFGRNALRSAGQFAGGLASAVAHPVDTASNMFQAAAGLVEKPVRAGMQMVTGRQIPPTAEEKKADALIGAYKDRYRGGLLEALYEDPVGVAGDVSLLAGGVAGVAGKSSQIGRAAGKLATATNPLNTLKVVPMAGRSVGAKLAEHGMGIGAKDRLFGKTPGRGILDETGSAVTPAGVAEKAEARMAALTAELEAQAAKAGNRGVMANIEPARRMADDFATHHGEGINQGLAGEMGDMAKSLRAIPSKDFHGATEYPAGATTKIAIGKRDPFTGTPGRTSIIEAPSAEIASEQLPLDALRLKRDFNARNVSWNGVRSDPATRAARQVYHELDSAIDRALPESAELNQRISSLIPVKDRGIMRAAGPGIAGSVADTITRPTGALASAAALAGGHAGVGILQKALLSAPTVQIALGKLLNVPHRIGGKRFLGATAGQRAAQAGLLSRFGVSGDE